jgi:choline dehydrogenase-like flavoprotein
LRRLDFRPLSIALKTEPNIKTWKFSDPRDNKKHIEEPVYKQIYHRVKGFFESFNSENTSDLHQAFAIDIRLEQAPNPLSRVTLIGDKDELGVPRAALNWSFTSHEKRSMRKIYEIIGSQAGATGIGRVKLKEELWDEKNNTMPTSTSGGWHHMGTTRMSDDPKNGVVDADCKIHGIQNLFIAGSSCFPTGGGANPTFTIVALSIRLADHLKEKLNVQNLVTAKKKAK